MQPANFVVKTKMPLPWYGIVEELKENIMSVES